MALVETGGADVRWEDIAHWVEEGSHTSEQMANYLNADHRHQFDCTISDVFDVLFDHLEVIFRDIGMQQDPANDNPQWQGLFDTRIRNLADNQRGTLLKQGWNRVLTKGQNSEAIIPTGSNPDPPNAIAQSNRYEKAGYTLAEWDEETQEIVVEDPGYTGPIDEGTDLEKAQQVHDIWLRITGGRRFGVVNAAHVDQVIADRQAQLEQEAAYQGTQDVAQRAENAKKAANDSYVAGNDRATVIADGDAAYATPLPPPT